jgi:hypothetical protein
MTHHAHTIFNGLTGVTASTAAVITTFQHQLEWWVRMSGASVGLIIAVITLLNLIKNNAKPR